MTGTGVGEDYLTSFKKDPKHPGTYNEWRRTTLFRWDEKGGKDLGEKRKKSRHHRDR